MSAILGVFGSEHPLSNEQVHDMLDVMSQRGGECVQLWRDGSALLAVARHEWEMSDTFSGRTLIAEDDRYVVAADASVYHRAELRGALERAGVVPREDTAAQLILAALHVWGKGVGARIDADFAVVVWDRREREAVAIRDFAGKRPLHYASLGREFVVASTIGGVVAHPRCPTDLNLGVIGATAAGMIYSAGPETAYKAVSVLQNAHHVSWSGRGAGEPVRYWEAPVNQVENTLKFEDAADHLRELLCDAARERMDPDAPNSVWMSGGWDSTSVFGAASLAAKSAGFAGGTLPVSISYPEGDPGREDEWIQSVADRWKVPVHWLNIADIPFLGDDEERAAERDEPYAHLYGRWNSSLAAGSRACGSRIALDGNGGDQLFQNSDVFLADLFRSGQWAALAREWPQRPRGGVRGFLSTVVQPNLGQGGHWLARQLRGGRPLRHYIERKLPGWLDPRFLEHYNPAERDREFMTRPISASSAMREIDWQFTTPFVARAFSLIGTEALAQGVELRSPLLDRRVIEFALSRPWHERSSGVESKKLLRRAMKGLLPDDVLAPRSHRTGVTGGYSHRWMSEVFPDLLSRTMETPLLLEEFGIVRPGALRSAAEQYSRSGDSFTRVNLFYTFHTELWLRARVQAPAPHGRYEYSDVRSGATLQPAT